ncbi:conserved hypothetical protein [Methanothermus fervidus DSM 2088]|uniref:Uncharacterized protein n=1 Tax=Methanothermus fervidus (strain ATCC 43054 / DSM 2088 / JCM 10308 / V24 S) TaxID=523846 RepID=E3GYX0_METFV|nr:DUF5379 family protein [Methanothermus fervidus]ADP77502.1 conserved hypothetical protein [Methanothermus fervidus DSM 2088]
MDTDAKITSIHTVSGIIAGFISYILSSGTLPIIGKNEALATFVGVIILLVVGNLCEKWFSKEEVGGFKGWFASGVIPFSLVWFLVWAMLLTMNLHPLHANPLPQGK